MIVHTVRIECEIRGHNDEIIAVKSADGMTLLEKLPRKRRWTVSIHPDIPSDMAGRIGVV